MLTFAQLPAWLKTGDFYLSMVSDVLLDKNSDKKKEEIDKKKEEIDAMEMVRHVKTDFSFTCLRDVLELLDSALYMGVDKLPPDIYSYCCETPALIVEMDRLESDPKCELAHYQHFTTTTEYTAFRICAGSHLHTQDVQLENAIKANNMPLVRYYIEDCNTCTMDHFSLAVKSGHIAVCEYIIKTTGWLGPIQDSWGHCLVAAVNGDLPMLRYLKEKVNVYCPYTVIEAALKHGKHECAEYALMSGCEGPIPRHTVDFAIQSGSIQMVRLLIEKGVCVADSYLLNFAIQFGRTDIANLLYENGAIPNDITHMIHNVLNETSYTQHGCLA